MTANKYYFTKPYNQTNINLTFEMDWYNEGQEDSIEIFQTNAAEEVIGVANDFETARFVHKEYNCSIGGNLPKPICTDVNYLFYFFSGNPTNLSNVLSWGNSYFAKAKDHLKNYALAVKKDENGEMSSMGTHIGKAYQEVESWINEKRLQIMNDKPHVESLTGAIIERVQKIENGTQDAEGKMVTKARKVAAIFIDYVQKLNSEEEASSRQQELHKVCKNLLNTSRDKRVNAAIILGAQANREVKSLELFQLDNMREAGDIEQDANLVIGVWDEEAGKKARLEKKLGLLYEKKEEEDLKLVPKGKDTEDHIGIIDKAMKGDGCTNKTLTLKILKNRNGQNNQNCSVVSISERFRIVDKTNEEHEKAREEVNELLMPKSSINL